MTVISNSGARTAFREKQSFKRTPLARRIQALAFASASMSLLVAPFASAQQQPEGAEALEEVVVTGIRRSLQNSLEAKRDSDSIIDAISAEEMGKLPDKNIGEALQRVTGVQLTRQGGEGRTVNIRGIDAALNRVEYNGTRALSTDPGGGRQVDFRDFPSEFVSRLEVVKSQTADVSEGGLGGTVRIISRKPLDNGGEDFFTFSAQAVHSDLSSSTEPRIAAFGSRSFQDGTFGVLGGFVYESRKIDTHQILSTGWVQQEDLNGDGSNNYRPFLPRPVIVSEDNDRLAFNGIAEWEPTDNLNLYVEGMYTQRNFDKKDQLFQVDIGLGTIDADNANATIASDGETALRFDSVTTGADNEDPRGASVAHRSLVDSFENDIFLLATGASWDSGRLSTEGRISYSEMTYDQVSYEPSATINQIPRITVDLDNKYRASNVDFHGFDVFDPGNFTSAAFTSRPRMFDKTELQAKVDFDYDLNVGIFTNLQWGAEYSDSQVDSDMRITCMRITEGEGEGNCRGLDGVADPSVVPTVQNAVSDHGIVSDDTFFNSKDLGFSVPSWYLFDQDFISAIVDDTVETTQDYGQTWVVDEETFAGYAKANFELDTAVPVRGNVGLRVVNTETGSNGFSTDGVAVGSSGSYTELLPSGGLTFSFVPDELLLKVGASSLLARPQPFEMAPRLSVSVLESTASRGTPDLDPFLADQLDLSLEYYSPNGLSFVSLAGFYKDVSSFIETVIVQDELPGFGEPGQIFSISEPRNGAEGVSIRGIELGGQLDLAEVTPALDGFGLIANATYQSDSGTANVSSVTGEALPFSGLSRTSYNLQAYYEDRGLSLRLAYNWRDEFLITPSGRGGIPEFHEAYGQFDASASYEITDQFSVFADFTNLTNEVRLENSSSELRRNVVESFGRRVFLGIRYRM